jgi:undecaprenyl-diphosphatase
MFRAMKTWFLVRLDAHDRALFSRFALDPGTRSLRWRAWLGVTHLGGATATIVAVLAPFFAGRGTVRHGAWLAGASLLVSHLIVQLVKRRAVRERPAASAEGRPLARVPDEFCFPSGHACASMAVAFSYGMTMPHLALPLVVAAAIVGWSRVRLGVHYPGDVLAGQAIAIVTVLGFWALGW